MCLTPTNVQATSTGSRGGRGHSAAIVPPDCIYVASGSIPAVSDFDQQYSKMPAYILLVACVGISVALVGVLCVYCIMHCWQLKKPVTAGSKKRDYMGQYSEVPVVTVRDKSHLPQIKISGASSLSSPDYPFSKMNNNPSDWTSADEVSSFCHTPQTPGSPSSLTSFNTCKEPLLNNGRSAQLSNGAPSTTTAFSFFQRFVGGSSTLSKTTSTEANKIVKVNGTNSNGQMFFDEHDDQEIDNRSVIHYELGFYEKTLTSCFRGTLTFELRYDFIHRVLMVHVLRANHLPAVERNRSSDPYVKMYLLPERRNHCKTRIFKKSLDPEFNEMFSFDVAYNNLPNRMLQFTVYDFDRFTRHGLIGNIIMRDLFEKSDLHSWTEYTMQIVGSQEKNDFGDLLLHLAYSMAEQKLYVTVSKAYNLRPMDITGASDPYVRISQIYQRRRVKMRKTSIKRANLNPVYHETIEFDLPASQIDETNFLVQVMDWDRIGRDDLLGCCVLGKESPTKEGRQQWEDCFSSFRSSASLNSFGYTQDETQHLNPRSVATWHSILGEVPDSFRNIPKAKK